MATYIVVHHRKDNQSWANSWIDDDLLSAITTTTEVSNLCKFAKEKSERIYVHRCACQESRPVISCSVEIGAVDRIDKTSWLISFINPLRLNAEPVNHPLPGQNSYQATPVA